MPRARSPAYGSSEGSPRVCGLSEGSPRVYGLREGSPVVGTRERMGAASTDGPCVRVRVVALVRVRVRLERGLAGVIDVGAHGRRVEGQSARSGARVWLGGLEHVVQ